MALTNRGQDDPSTGYSAPHPQAPSERRWSRVFRTPYNEPQTVVCLLDRATLPERTLRFVPVAVSPNDNCRMSSRFQFTLRTLSILTTILALLLGIGRWLYLNLDEYHVATLDCGGGRKIIITAASSWEMSQPVCYQVVVDGATVVPKWTFHYAHPPERLRFSLVTAEEGDLVGVVSESGDRHDALILHDFRTGDSWPALFFNGNSPGVERRLGRAFNRLQAENPGLRMSVCD